MHAVSPVVPRSGLVDADLRRHPELGDRALVTGERHIESGDARTPSATRVPEWPSATRSRESDPVNFTANRSETNLG